MIEQLLHDLLLLILVWLLVAYWPIWAISRQKSRPLKKQSFGGGKKACDPEPYPGLSRKPECHVCQKEAVGTAKVPEPPQLMTSVRGAPSTVDTCRQFCPREGCAYYGWRQRGNIIANGRPGGGLWRQYYCKACKHYFLETTGTVFFGKRQAVPVLLFVLAALVEGLGIRAAGRVFGLEADTIHRWLLGAAGQLSALADHILTELEPSSVQLDELYTPTLGLPETDDAGLAIADDARLWLWTAMDPVSKLLLVAVVGPRSLTVAQRVVHLVKQRLVSTGRPLFLTDGLSLYRTALLTHFGQWQSPPPSPAGCRLKPRWMPLPDLRYAQLIKQHRRRRLVAIKHRFVFGTRQQVQAILDQLGCRLNTAFIERLNLTIRQHLAALARRTSQRAHTSAGLSPQVELFLIYYNICLPHSSLRRPPDKHPLNQTRDCTPAMAAGLTDNVWSLREVLLYRVPPWPQERWVG